MEFTHIYIQVYSHMPEDPHEEIGQQLVPLGDGDDADAGAGGAGDGDDADALAGGAAPLEKHVARPRSFVVLCWRPVYVYKNAEGFDSRCTPRPPTKSLRARKCRLTRIGNCFWKGCRKALPRSCIPSTRHWSWGLGPHRRRTKLSWHLAVAFNDERLSTLIRRIFKICHQSVLRGMRTASLCLRRPWFNINHNLKTLNPKPKKKP